MATICNGEKAWIRWTGQAKNHDCSLQCMERLFENAVLTGALPLCEHCSRPIKNVEWIIEDPPDKLSPCRHRYILGQELKMPFTKIQQIFGDKSLLFAKSWILDQKVYSDWTGDQNENPAIKEYKQTQEDIRGKRNWRKEHQESLDVICASKEKSSSKLPLALLAVGFFLTIGILYKYGKLNRLYQGAQDLSRKIAASWGCPFDRTIIHSIKKALPPCVHRRLSL